MFNFDDESHKDEEYQQDSNVSEFVIIKTNFENAVKNEDSGLQQSGRSK